ncbi:molybdenum cofactor biosynthesis protein MoaE [Pseudolysobacter antarcticus]|uniref:Molybdopterin synthase catalytic subunit n=1 Tax=Pseudolysobacter antarcticus TaxID=2511995 RepID=A0A411HIE3_9GAMM|nr:molybdenum cofactor biosynthesis protein MoaE [Pseudolysobacter antarcticus]QBB70286.1 molybdenum cofactor biosynthesis protein MoaE [Pseudolysobacter antarcticus]
MKQFLLCPDVLDPQQLAQKLSSDRAGAFVSFEGRVRNRNNHRVVQRLEYQAYAALAEIEGARILMEASEKFAIEHACCAHRVGTLAIGDIAVWVGVSSAHRDAAFACCRYIIDEVKLRVPIWKNEHYADGESGWLHPDNTPVDPG